MLHSPPSSIHFAISLSLNFDMLSIAGQVPIYLVVDVLEECPYTWIPSLRRKLLDLVKELVELQRSNFHLSH